MMEKNRSESIAMQFAKAEMQANLIERGYAGHKLTDDQFMILMSKPTQEQVKSVLAALDRSEAIEALAESWAEKWGHEETDIEDAQEFLRLLEKRGFTIVRKETI